MRLWRWLRRWWLRRAIDVEMARYARAHEESRIRTSDDWRDRELT